MEASSKLALAPQSSRERRCRNRNALKHTRRAKASAALSELVNGDVLSKSEAEALSNPTSSPVKTASPLVLEFDSPPGSQLYIGCQEPFTSSSRPGNGGMRLWNYGTPEEAIAECIGLSKGMSAKHNAFSTGFSGAKLVVNAEDPSKVDKRELMRAASNALNQLNGAIYTGQDLNTTEQDMDYLSSLAPYVLAGLRSKIDTNVATGYGVFGALQGLCSGVGRHVDQSTFLVHGTGKVGATVAKCLSQAGAHVLTFDICKASADIQGCRNVSDEDWASIPCDVLVPCSVSGLIGTQEVESLDCKYICGASNLPFDGAEVHSRLVARGIGFLSECISSAGAVIVDSIEAFDRPSFLSSRPHLIYHFVRDTIKQKAEAVLAAAKGNTERLPETVKAMSIDAATTGQKAGMRFSEWEESQTERWDSLIIGGGMAGTSAARSIAKARPGETTCVLEASQIANDKGSSYGESRMYRQMYTDTYFSEMQKECLHMWNDIEKESGTKLLSEHGLLFYGETDTGETVEGSVPGAVETCKQLGIPHTHMSSKQMESAFPMFCLDNDEGVFEETAGSVDSGRACQAMAGLALSAGASICEGERVDDIHVAGKGEVHAITSSGRSLKAKRAVLGAGAWTNNILAGMGYSLDLEVHNVHWAHYNVSEELANEYPQWFCFRKGDGNWDGGLYYGFPSKTVTSSRPSIKVGVDFTPDDPKFKTSDIENFHYEPDQCILTLIDQFMEKHWAGVGERTDAHCSPYTMTPDNYFVLDHLPGVPEIVLFTGGSGRAFKFAPLLGECMADLALGRTPSRDISPFRATRPACGLRQTHINT